MEESNNWLKGLFRNTDSYAKAKDTESKGTTTQQSTQMPWSPNVISNLESGITTERLIEVANNPSLESLERGKTKDQRDPLNSLIFTLRKFNKAYKGYKRPKIPKANE
jgi:hypothetical protein